jgi:hypothetical protein
VQQGEQEVPHVQVSVGQTSGVMHIAETRIRRDDSQFETHRSFQGTGIAEVSPRPGPQRTRRAV